jgi:molybdopterin-containing oxidoreductase family iron-sulfur binding subunit
MTNPSDGPRYWRSLDERSGAAPTQPSEISREFPEGATELDGATRREFLKLLGGTAALAVLGGCFANPSDPVLPYARSPEGVVPGNPLHYATTLTLDGYATGVIVTSNEGRPTKVEGNPEHPASLGAAGVFEQAAIYQLYDPQRARALRRGNRPQAWRQFLGDSAARAARWKQNGGAGLRFLVEPNGSPLEAALRAQLLSAFPAARIFAWSALPQDSAYEGTRIAFGQPLEPQLDFGRARVIVSLDGDFLAEGPFRLRYARAFAEHRVPEHELNRLYVAEARHSITGATADHRLRLRASDVHALAQALYAEVAPDKAPPPSGPFAGHKWVKAVAADLKRRPSEALVVAGRGQPPAVHALACAINAALGSEAVSYIRPVLADTAAGPAALQPLADEINAGRVDTLVVTAYNPVYTAPADLDLAALFDRVPNVIYRGLYEDETTRHANWFIPATHELESWGDARAADGTVSLQQPLITPLWNGLTTAEVLGALLGRSEGAYRLLKDFWATQHKGADFESWWSHVVQKGLVAGSASPTERVTPSWEAVRALAAPAPQGGLEIVFRPDAKIYDGRFADNAWLQELPDPMTKVTWGSALELSPRTAERLGLETESVARVAVGGRTLEVPVFVLPGHADESVSLALGYGRSGAEMIARELGRNANLLRTVAAPAFALGVTLTAVGRRSPLSVTQGHWSMESRPVALDVQSTDLKRRLPLVEEQQAPLPTMYAQHPYPGLRWAMAIDMSRCTGCSACMVACSSENNILVVGADQVRRSREMHWLRIDRYFTGEPAEPDVVMQPLACVHCENAPCEYVCPVNATVHSDEGLNEMVYNRCVGTRYCSNNCPYKVRRFNFLNWHKNLQGTEEMAMNPEVSVRARGVMEKCTYCVQRIERWRITSRNAGRELSDYRDQEITTACAQACPSQAIVFGSLHDPSSQVSRLQADRRSYQTLHQLGTRPRTTHLAKVRNPNPELT